MMLTLPPEMTTAVTDAILGCFALFFLFKIKSLKAYDPQKISIWVWVFSLLVFVSFYGTIAHAIVMTKETLNAFWMPLSFALGMMVSLFVVGVIYEWRGPSSLKKTLVFMLSAGVAFFIAMFILSKYIEGYFIVFVAYSTLTMLFSLIVYTVLAVKRKDASAGLMAAGIFTILAGSGVQSMRQIFFTVVWEFDYNTVYHFFMMAAVVMFYAGIKKRVQSIS